MSRLPRPYIPLAVRVQVAERQLKNIEYYDPPQKPLSARLRKLLAVIGELWRLNLGYVPKKMELHHRPALVNRRRKRNGDYDPPATHPDYLVYLPADEHDIETRVRGLHGQHSDLGLARKRKRAERKAKRPKTRWPSRPLRFASRWSK